MSLSDGVDGLHNIPVDGGGTRRSGHRSLVRPSCSHVNHHHKVSVSYFGRPLISSLVPHERVEELIDNLLFSVGDSVIVLVI
jgi:hypothetical protein